MSSVIQVK